MPKKSPSKPTKPTTKKPAIQINSNKNRGNDSSEDDDADKTASHLKKEDYVVITEWLKIKWNYNSCFGTLLLLVYQKVHTKYISTGFGLTKEDCKVGISTVPTIMQ
ncbi:uncharacterized protein VP01_9652g1 [Puccinia sorghi]|uniref:Uncharacterized protein n=1 Tax=Puccinia sorghi TaxID=27349 RepID=A0A0L6U635_9BASI|nr:uncharacterized protein VP01_9652g1 [Puccinia sorghi]